MKNNFIDSGNSKPMWKKRVDIVNYLYEILMQNNNVFKPNGEFEKWQNDIISYYFSNKQEIHQLITEFLAKDWSWERINNTDKAIMIEAYCEFHTKKTDPKILISEAMKTAKNYGELENKGYINAILSKILMNNK